MLVLAARSAASCIENSIADGIADQTQLGCDWARYEDEDEVWPSTSSSSS
jgi:hypothetical protein